MVRLLLSGPREFTDRVQQQAQEFPEVKIVSLTTEPSTTVDMIEKGLLDIDAVLLGFQDEDLEIMIDVIARNQVSCTVFVSVENLAAVYRKWAQHRVKLAPAGRELGAVYGYFSRKKDFSAREIPESESKVEFDKNVRVETVKERESRNRVVFMEKRVITVFGQKGGVGKTVITVSLAQSLALAAGIRVAVLDLDMSRDYGDVIRYFGFIGSDKEELVAVSGREVPIREKTLLGWTEFPYGLRFDRKFVDSCLIAVEKNLFVLPPVCTIANAGRVTRETVQKTVDVLRRNFGVVLIDAGNMLTDATAAAVEVSDDLLIVSSAQLTVLDSLASFTADAVNTMIKGSPIIAVVINMVPAKLSTEIRKELPRLAGGYPIVAQLPRDGKIEEIMLRQAVPYYGAHDIPFAKEMEKLLCYLFPKEAFRGTAKKEGLLKNFLKKLRFGRVAG